MTTHSSIVACTLETLSLPGSLGSMPALPTPESDSGPPSYGVTNVTKSRDYVPPPQPRPLRFQESGSSGSQGPRAGHPCPPGGRLLGGDRL